MGGRLLVDDSGSPSKSSSSISGHIGSKEIRHLLWMFTSSASKSKEHGSAQGISA